MMILAGLWFHMFLLNCCTWRPSSCVGNLYKLVHILCLIGTTIVLLYISWNLSQFIFFLLTVECCWLSDLWTHISICASVLCQCQPLEDAFRTLYTCMRCVLPSTVMLGIYFYMWNFRFSLQELWKLVSSCMGCCVTWEEFIRCFLTQLDLWSSRH
jgi:hypothetical protein